MITALQALSRSNFREVREDAASGIKLELSDAGFSTGKGVQGGGIQGQGVTACTLSGEEQGPGLL